MGDSSANQAGWAQQWIRQQRDLLDRAVQSGPAKAGFEQVNGMLGGLSGQWAELGKTYLAGLMQLAQSLGGATTDGASAQPAGEVLDTWKAAWTNAMSQASAPGGWSELLNRTPPLGLFREQTEAWRAVAAARADMERLEQELATVLRRVQSEALLLVEERVKTRAGTDNPVQGFREIYDLWVECSEQVFSTVAHSSAYAHLQGELGNAAMRLRSRMQKVIEQSLKQFDLPTRSEINSLHQQVRSLKQKVAALERGTSDKTPAASAPAAARKSASKTEKRQAVPATRPARKRSR